MNMKNGRKTMRRFAKRSVLAPILLLALSGVPTAGHADTATTTVKGSIKVDWNEVLTATEASWDCENQPDTIANGGLQGFDAFIIKLPEGSVGHDVREVYRKGVANQDPAGVGVVAPDIDYYFAGDGCAVNFDYTAMATAAIETGTVPEGSKFLIGFLFAGDPVHFTIEIDHDVAP